jgi:arabinose-5-phosphate isomerase
MKSAPRTISATEFAVRALSQMEERKITSLVVTDDRGRVEGIVHLHDLWGTEMF